ncbi:MAG: hypothetical protein GXP26_16390 [Planctomycetes bacterium]|nr:hypothetical protein [Planctomycetota bacterium]
MSRFSVGAVCALLTLAGLTMSGHLGAQEENNSPGLEAANHTEVKNAEERIEAILDRRLKAPLEFEEEPLSDACAQIADEYELLIQFDNAAFDEIAISPDTEFTLAPVRNVMLRSALNLMLKQPGLEDLTYIIENEVLLFTTEERANESLVTRVYRVDDLDCSESALDSKSLPQSQVRSSKRSEKSKQPNRSTRCRKVNYYGSLPQVIVDCIDFDSWQRNGTGEGEIYVMKPGILVVSQTRKVHRKIIELLADLRDVSAEIRGK